MRRVPLEAVFHLADIGTGDTRPQIFVCDNAGEQQRWALKLMGLSAGELAADLIGSMLAQGLGLPSPPVAVAQVSSAALRTSPPDVQQWARPGPAFASRWLQGVVSGLTDASVAALPAADLGRMYALDAWLEVLDRRKPDGIWNVLQAAEDGSLIVLDYGKSLTPCLQFVIGGSDEVLEPAYPASVRRAASLPDALEACDTIESVTRDELERIVAEVPDAWITDETRSKVVRFLADRAGRVREVCGRSLGGGVP